ncbi:hypothetical protein ACTMUQ_29340 [Streptomyces sp. SD11]|uniref:hypothetical protein n=1 Tax=Streptomyces sp. SD11 TaxID=3452209 RepID=UPI003F8C8488
MLDWHRGQLSSRRLSVLVQHLPRDSALIRALHGEAADWSVTDYLLAAVVDQLAEANWMFATVNRDEDAESIDFPEPVPRPGADHEGPAPETAPRRQPSALELAQFFG